jgi:hypothetical protein
MHSAPGRMSKRLPAIFGTGSFSGGLPYLAVGSGEPLVYLCGLRSSSETSPHFSVAERVT